MSKSSVVTARQAPVAGEAKVSTGSLTIQGETFEVVTHERVALIDLTDTVMRRAHESGVREGTVSLWSMQTTCTLFINESQQALHADILQFLDETVDRHKYYRHNDPALSDCDRQNADSHLKALLLGHSLTLQIAGGELVLGQWQRVLMGELDGPRTRKVRVQIMGIVA